MISTNIGVSESTPMLRVGCKARVVGSIPAIPTGTVGVVVEQMNKQGFKRSNADRLHNIVWLKVKTEREVCHEQKSGNQVVNLNDYTRIIPVRRDCLELYVEPPKESRKINAAVLADFMIGLCCK